VSGTANGRTAGPIVVHARPYGEALAGGLRSALPATETVVVCEGSDGIPPTCSVPASTGFPSMPSATGP